MKRFIVVITTLVLLAQCSNNAGAQTVLTNGANEAGSLLANTTNAYTFTASTGDSINVRLGSTYSGKLQLFGPGGVFLSTSQNGYTDNLITDTATNSGTYTVLVGTTVAGTYELSLAQAPEPFIVSPGYQGGPMTNGGAYSGTIPIGDQQMWSFTANAGDNISVRLGSSGFYGRLLLYGPNGALVASAQDGYTDNLIGYMATNSGTFTVLVSADYAPGYSGGENGTGTYVLSLAQFPEPFIVTPGYQGGRMTNGGVYSGTIPIGDQQMWSFTANKGDSISVRLGTTGFDGLLQLFGPNGAEVASVQDGYTDNLVTDTATNSGTFTVLVSADYAPGYSGGENGTGTYELSLAQAPEPFIVSPGYQGGPMTNGGAYTGTITLGDQDMWSFTANAGDNISVRLGSSGFFGRLLLYGPNGALVASAQDGYTDNLIGYMATNSGTFIVLVSADYAPGYAGGENGTGTYVLSLAQAPESFIVSPGYQGGPMTNGGVYSGTIPIGDQQMWSFTANKGDSISVRLGTTGFDGLLQLFGPNGVEVTYVQDGYTDNLITDTATNSGTYTVLVSADYAPGYAGGENGTGTYVLSLAQAPESFIVSPGYQGGPMTNGGAYTGTITLGDQDMWSFTANAGDNISVRLGSSGFFGRLLLYGPNGALVASAQDGYTDNLIGYMATNSGTFIVLVSADYAPGYAGGENGTGTYVLSLAQAPESFIVSPGYQGGPMTNGGVYSGTIPIGDQQMWSFTANKGDSISVRLGTTGFDGLLQLFGPNGVEVTYVQDGYTDNLITDTATNSGTFTVLVSADYAPGYSGGENGTGTYELSLAQAPEPFIVSPGYQGGPMTNGGAYSGTIPIGDQQMWSFTANAGDNISVRLGSSGFYGRLLLYGPNGALVASAQDGYTDNLIGYMATNSGTFTVLVSADYAPGYSGGENGTGTYVLSLAQFPEPFIVPSGNPGGAMTGNATYAGTITLGAQDMFTFTACTGDSINLGLKTTNFDGNLELFGSNGALLKSAASSTSLSIAYTVTNCGNFSVLVSAYYAPGYSGGAQGTGTYGLTANGLIYAFKICSPVITGTVLNVSGVGGTSGTNAILSTTTNIANPALWTPIRTNAFDQFGVFEYTNGFNPAEPQRFFRLSHP